MATFIKDIEEIRRRARQKIEDGAVTEAYELDKERAVDVLNEALATEIVCVLRYLHHYFMATGVHGRAVADEFKEHADDEREHADVIAERIQQLGGKPDFNPASLLQRSVAQYVEGETLADMIREDLIAERTVIDVYQEMIHFFGEKDPTTRRLLEHIKAQEEEHATDLSDFLYIVNPQSGETAGLDPGTDPLHIQSEGGVGFGPSQSQMSGGQEGRNRQLDRAGRRMVSDAEQALERLHGGEPEAPQESGRSGSTERDRGASKREEREPFAGRGTVEAPPSNLPGVSGRTMNRRRTEDEIDTDDVARRTNPGASAGTNRSSKIVNKNRKNRRVA